METVRTRAPTPHCLPPPVAAGGNGGLCWGAWRAMTWDVVPGYGTDRLRRKRARGGGMYRVSAPPSPISHLRSPILALRYAPTAIHSRTFAVGDSYRSQGQSPLEYVHARPIPRISRRLRRREIRGGGIFSWNPVLGRCPRLRYGSPSAKTRPWRWDVPRQRVPISDLPSPISDPGPALRTNGRSFAHIRRRRFVP